ncbi:protein HGH1 homolog [Orycteropus afer afer]|uniref:Protein HGH1 homolog n=1 Tax=Orycteropus afer afer TaxID=1230840 RepID=A0A8B7B299_ORYAF|nr:protein HGH1 homolog [Orycteropus afer afer]
MGEQQEGSELLEGPAVALQGPLHQFHMGLGSRDQQLPRGRQVPQSLGRRRNPAPSAPIRPVHRVRSLGLVAAVPASSKGGAAAHEEERGADRRGSPGLAPPCGMEVAAAAAAAGTSSPGGAEDGGVVIAGSPILEAGAQAEAAELLPFLAPGARADLQAVAARHVLALTGSGPGRALLAGQAALLRALAELAAAPAPAPACDAARALVNLAADPGLHEPLLAADRGLPARLLGRALDPQWPWADEAAAALANLSRESEPCAAVMAVLAAPEPGEPVLERLVRALCTPGYNARAPLHYLGPLLSNLSQRPAARAFLLDPDRCVIQRLLPLTQYPDSSVRRGGVVGTLRNCCFEHRHHEWLLGSEVDILPFLLLPLAGPEDFSEEEMERLPVDLQYLPPDKQREPDADIRKMLIEAVMLLTATAAGRRQVRDQGAYLVLRELHSWEPEPAVRVTCEKLIQVLIGDEPECGMGNLLEVQVPEELEHRLQQLDRQEQERCEQERQTPQPQRQRPASP